MRPRSLTHGIKRTRERLTAFEKQFGMTSEEFERRYTAAEIDETLASIEWLGEIKMLRVLSEQKLALDGAWSSDRHLLPFDPHGAQSVAGRAIS